jgi:hypothetical protein
MTTRSNIWTRKYKMGEEPRVDHVERALSPGERIALVWEITKNAWAFKEPGWDATTSRLRRDVVRVVRSRR